MTLSKKVKAKNTSEYPGYFLENKGNITQCFLSVYQTKIHYIRIHYRQMILMIKISTVINANKPIPANTYSILPPCLNGRML